MLRRDIMGGHGKHTTCHDMVSKQSFFNSWAHAQPAPTDQFWWSMRHITCFCARCAFWGSRCCHSPFRGWNLPQKNSILGAWIGLFKPNGHYCIDSNQILHSNRDLQVVIVGGRNTRPTNPRFWTAANLKKKLLNCHISTTVRQI